MRLGAGCSLGLGLGLGLGLRCIWVRSRGRGRTHLSVCKQRHVEWVQTVDVLSLADAGQHDVLVNVAGQRQLHEDAVDGRVRVQLVYLGEARQRIWAG